MALTKRETNKQSNVLTVMRTPSSRRYLSSSGTGVKSRLIRQVMLKSSVRCTTHALQTSVGRLLNAFSFMVSKHVSGGSVPLGAEKAITIQAQSGSAIKTRFLCSVRIELNFVGGVGCVRGT